MTSRSENKAKADRLRLWHKLAKQSKFQAKKLARQAEITVRQLERHFKEDLGRSPQDWLNEQRIIEAKSLLRQAGSVQEVATQLGYKQNSQFSRDFKRYYGMTPSKMLNIPEDD